MTEASWRRGVEDPLFMRDSAEIAEAFADADAETAGQAIWDHLDLE